MKRVTMMDIAREAGVSKNAVSLALRNDPQIPEKTRQRIQAIADRLDYRKDPVVAQLMARLRTTSEPEGNKATLGLINANEKGDAFTNHPTIPRYVEGCRRRASQLGYSLDTFWLYDPEINATRLQRILRARGIRGLLIVGLMNRNRLPEEFSEIWESFPCIVTGVRTRKPAISFASTDHHIITLRAFEHALELGYRRPGLVLDRTIDLLVEGRFSAGYRTAQEPLPRKERLNPLIEDRKGSGTLKTFEKWLKKERPDVIFTLYNDVRDQLESLGYKTPDDIGLIQLEWRPDRPNWAGMNQHNDLVGEAAVDMIISLLHSGESGPPPFPRATLIGGSWVDGITVRRQVSENKLETAS